MGSVALDFSKAQPITPAGGSVALDFSKAQPIGQTVSNFSANPKGEGVYRMNGPSGQQGIPFSNVYPAQKAGYSLDPSDQGRFQNDWAAAPGQRNMIAPSSPSLLDRITGPIANSVIGKTLEQSAPSVASALHLTPTETVNSPTYQSDRNQIVAPQYIMPGTPQGHIAGIAKGALTGAGKLTSANSLATMTALAATGGLAAPLAPLATGLKVAGTGMGVYGTGKDLSAAAKAYFSGNNAQGDEQLGEALPNALLTLPAAGKPIEATGDAAQTAGEGVINTLLGARKKDFARGSSPGTGYFQARLGPSLSTGSIAAKSGDVLGLTGAAIGDRTAGFQNAGGLIPYDAGALPIQANIASTRAALSGAGGTGSTSALDDYEATWLPLLDAAQKRGGFLPEEYAAAKRNTASNTTWGDPSQAGMKDLRQQTVGGMGGALVDSIPELAPLNSTYQNTLKLNRLASERSQTGSIPLSGLASKLMTSAAGAGVGASAHGPLGAIGGLMAGTALDSVPAKTTLASALFYGGKGLSLLGGKLSGLSDSSVIPALNSQEDGVGNSYENQSGNGTTNQTSQSTPPSAPYRLQNLTPEIIRPGEQSRSRFGVGTDGRAGVMIRPLAALPAPIPPPPEATPFQFSPKPPTAVAARPLANLNPSLGSRASLVPLRMLQDVVTPGTPEEQAAALRLSKLGSLGNLVPPRLIAPPKK